MISPRGIRSEEHVAAAAAAATKPFHHLYHHHQDSFVCWMDGCTDSSSSCSCLCPSVCLATDPCHEKLSRKLRPFRGRSVVVLRKCVRNSRLQIVIKFDYQAPQGGNRISGNR